MWTRQRRLTKRNNDRHRDKGHITGRGGGDFVKLINVPPTKMEWSC